MVDFLQKSLYQKALEIDIKLGTESGDESVYSFQDYDTEFAKSVDGSSDNLEGMEFEPVDDSSCSSLSDSESDFEDGTCTIRDRLTETEDSAAFADSSSDCELESRSIEVRLREPESCSDSDADVKHWVCIQCRRFHSTPMRFCRNCYEERSESFPKRKRKRAGRRVQHVEMAPAPSPVPMTSLPVPMTSLPVPMTSIPCTASESVDMVDGYDVVDGPMPKRPRMDDDCPSTSQDSGIGKTEPTPPVNACGICFARPANAAFVHGRSGHVIYCYICSKKMSKCPVCNRKVNRVIKLFHV